MIYNPPDCSEKSANFTGYHALNGVGWGHDKKVGLDYVIMRNSWGMDLGLGTGNYGYNKVALLNNDVGVC